MGYCVDLSILDKLSSTKILVVGDVMLDEYLVGDVDRMSPESPVPVFEQRATDVRLGGAGNVVANLVDLGCRVTIASVIGDDTSGHWLRDKLLTLGVDVSALILDKNRPTTVKTRVIAQNQQLIRIDREDRRDITQAAAGTLLTGLEGHIASYGAVILSDYGKGVLTDEVLAKLIKLSIDVQVPVLADPKTASYRRYVGATLLTPNRKEAEQAVGFTLQNDQDIDTAGRTLMHCAESQAMLITLGQDGMVLFRVGETPLRLPTRAREVYDVVGAGDTVIATLAAVMAAGGNLATAAELANMAAGLVVGKVGTATVSPLEIRIFANGNETNLTAQKIVTNEAAADIASRLRDKKRVVVFTNGCFDLLHMGHIEYLHHARALGDCLIVGLDSDLSVRRLKGENRPILNQCDRASILSALSCVDFITIFESDGLPSLIETIRPHVLVKGDDYSLDKVVGRETVEADGGRVELVPTVKGHSTTSLIERIMLSRDEA